jgi:hypothetical protein
MRLRALPRNSQTAVPILALLRAEKVSAISQYTLLLGCGEPIPRSRKEQPRRHSMVEVEGLRAGLDVAVLLISPVHLVQGRNGNARKKSEPQGAPLSASCLRLSLEALGRRANSSGLAKSLYHHST